MKPAKILAVLFVLLLLLLAAAWFGLNSWLGSESFKNALIARCSEPAGLPVTVQSFRLSLLDGFKLEKLSVGNSGPGHENRLFEASSVDFRYRFLPLLQGKVEVEKLVLDHPQIFISQSAEGSANLPIMGSPSPAPGLPGSLSRSMDINIREFSIIDGSATVRKPGGDESFSAAGLNLDSLLNLAGNEITLKGSLSAARLSFTPLLLTDFKSPFVLEKKIFKLEKISAEAFGGNLAGSGNLDLNQKNLPFSLDLKGNGLQLAQLAEQIAGKKSPLSGNLELDARLVAPLTDPLLVQGRGHFEIKEVVLGENPVLHLLGELLKIKELRGGKFDLAVSDFAIGGKLVNLSNLVVNGKLLTIRGGGNIDFQQNYDLQLVLNLQRGLAEQLPGEIKSAFIANADGSLSSPPFRVYGSADNLHQTLLQELIQQKAKSELEKRAGGLLQKLFK